MPDRGYLRSNAVGPLSLTHFPQIKRQWLRLALRNPKTSQPFRKSIFRHFTRVTTKLIWSTCCARQVKTRFHWWHVQARKSSAMSYSPLLRSLPPHWARSAVSVSLPSGSCQDSSDRASARNWSRKGCAIASRRVMTGLWCWAIRVISRGLASPAPGLISWRTNTVPMRLLGLLRFAQTPWGGSRVR